MRRAQLNFDPEHLNSAELYGLLIGAIVPRPIAWVSSVDSNNRVNVAPFSFFTVVAADPPTLGISVMSRNGQPKDTSVNAGLDGEIVVNVVTERTLEQASLTSIEAPQNFDEAQFANLTLVPSVRVGVPGIAQSPVHFECRVKQQLLMGREDNPSHFILAEVIFIQVDDSVMSGSHIDPLLLQAVGRMGGPFYSTTSDIWQLSRPVYPPGPRPRLRRLPASD